MAVFKQAYEGSPNPRKWEKGQRRGSLANTTRNKKHLCYLSSLSRCLSERPTGSLCLIKLLLYRLVTIARMLRLWFSNTSSLSADPHSSPFLEVPSWGQRHVVYFRLPIYLIFIYHFDGCPFRGARGCRGWPPKVIVIVIATVNSRVKSTKRQTQTSDKEERRRERSLWSRSPHWAKRQTEAKWACPAGRKHYVRWQSGDSDGISYSPALLRLVVGYSNQSQVAAAWAATVGSATAIKRGRSEPYRALSCRAEPLFGSNKRFKVP